MTTKVVEASEAQLLTAAVQIQTVTVRGKQMTLSVFRQVQLEDALDYQRLTVRGTLWGTVNYFPSEDNRSAKRFVHILWQHGSELRRCYLSRQGVDCRELPVRHAEDAAINGEDRYLFTLKNNVWTCLYSGPKYIAACQKLNALRPVAAGQERAYDSIYADRVATLPQLFIAV